MAHWTIRDADDAPHIVFVTGPGVRAHPMHPRAAAKHVLRHGAAGDALTWHLAGTAPHHTTVGAYRAVVRRRQLVLGLKVILAVLLVLALLAPIAGWL